MVNLTDFKSTYGSYENCPVDRDLLVWTGDSYEVEYVTTESEFGTYYPANGVKFSHFITLPCGNEAQNLLTTEKG